MMVNLGNAWHFPVNPEPRGRAGMRDPVGVLVPGTAITIFSGNQFQGAGNPRNQLEAGSTIFLSGPSTRPGPHCRCCSTVPRGITSTTRRRSPQIRSRPVT